MGKRNATLFPQTHVWLWDIKGARSSCAISLRPLRSIDRDDLFVPRARTTMAQTQAFAIIGPSLWNQPLPSTRSPLLIDEPGASFRSFKIVLFSLGLSLQKRFRLV